MPRVRSLSLFAVLLAILIVPSAPLVAVEPVPHGTRTVYLVRHGQYDHEDPRDEDVGKGLVPLGVAQARLLGARLRSMDVVWSSLTSSTMTRARETARVLAEDLPDLRLETSTLLRECLPPTRQRDIMAGESPEAVKACVEQLEAAWDRFMTPSPGGDRHDLLVIHGNVIRYFVMKALQVDTEAWLGMSIGNCSLTVIQIAPDRSMKVLSFSDVGHIPPRLQTRTAPGVPRDLAVPAGPKTASTPD